MLSNSEAFIKPNGFKKSLYIFLCSLMGMLLFLILQRLVVIGYFSLTSKNLFEYFYFYSTLGMAVEYLTLFLFILFGSWYGIWIGLGWYRFVYESSDCCKNGLVNHIVKEYWPSEKHKHSLSTKVKDLALKMDTAVTITRKKSIIKKPKVIKKKIAKKK